MQAVLIRRARPMATLLVALGLAGTAHAVPVTYNFSTAPISSATWFGGGSGGVDPELLAALSGLSVTGSFAYDNEVPLSGTQNGPLVFGQSNYQGAISGLTATLGTFAFSAPTGGGNVADEGYAPPLPAPLPPAIPADFFQLGTLASAGQVLGDYTLAGARLFWIENSTGGGLAPDFLSGNDLPSLLPTFSGRLALDFVTSAQQEGPTLLHIGFFENLAVTAAPVETSVPEPGTLSLLIAAGAGMLAFKRRRPTGKILARS
jgi:hypothetical protein